MKPTQLDHVRDALRRETEHLQPVGLQIEDIKRRGGHRRTRSRAFVAVATVTCLAGVGVAVAQRPTGKHVVDIASQPTTPPPPLQFRVVDGELSFATHFTGSDGTTYALSTAPGVASNPAEPGQAIYSTKDGEHWTTADQAKSWISDLAEGNGVLYAIGTSPGATANDVNYLVGTSTDGGQKWSDATLPFDNSTPSATVSLSRSTAVQLARRATTTVALLTEQFSPDLSTLIAARTAGHPNVSTLQTVDGFNIIDLGACVAGKQGLVRGAGAIDATTTIPSADAAPRVVPGCQTPPVLGTISWSDIGLHSAADLTRQQMVVSTDGTHWDHVAAPAAGGVVSDLVASGDGFLLLGDSGRTYKGSVPGEASTLMRSTDARTWTNVAIPADLSVQAISGDRAIGVDGSGTIQASNDGGTTWTATDAKAQLPAGSAAGTVMTVDAGPLGFAAIVNGNANTNGTAVHAYLLFSIDGVTWSTTDLATAGIPANTYPAQVIVGADHVGVDFQSRVGGPDQPRKTTTLLGTPQR